MTESASRTGTGCDKAYMETMPRRIPIHRLGTVKEATGAAVIPAGASAGAINRQMIVGRWRSENRLKNRELRRTSNRGAVIFPLAQYSSLRALGFLPNSGAP